jgi:hypothetical protein
VWRAVSSSACCQSMYSCRMLKFGFQIVVRNFQLLLIIRHATMLHSMQYVIQISPLVFV